MKNRLFLLVFVSVTLVSFATAWAKDSNSPAQNENINKMRERGLRPPPSVDQTRRNKEINRLKNMSKEQRREELRKMREKRRREIDPARGRTAPGVTPTRNAPGNPQQLEALNKHIAKEDAKYLKRVAKLKRIRELAAEGNDQKTVARVDKLLMREQNRYSNKSDRLRTQKRMYDRFKRDREQRSVDKEKNAEAINRARRERGNPRPTGPAEKPSAEPPQPENK